MRWGFYDRRRETGGISVFMDAIEEALDDSESDESSDVDVG